MALLTRNRHAAETGSASDPTAALAALEGEREAMADKIRAAERDGDEETLAQLLVRERVLPAQVTVARVAVLESQLAANAEREAELSAAAAQSRERRETLERRVAVLAGELNRVCQQELTAVQQLEGAREQRFALQAPLTDATGALP